MPENKKKLDLAALASIPLIMTLSNSMLIPILPLMQKKLGITSVQSSMIITVYAAISILCIPIAGYLSDRFGRKLIILIGLSIVAIGGAMSGVAAWLMNGMNAYWLILIGRFIQGIGAAGAFPIVIPLVGDMFNSEKEVSSGLGMIETSNTLGKVLSPIIGSALALIVWFLPLATIPVISAVSIIAVACLVKAPKKKDADITGLTQFLKTIKGELKKNGSWLYAIFAIGGGVMFIMFGFLYYLSSIIEEKYHIDGIWKGALLAIPLLAICLASFAAGKLVGENKARMKWFTVIGIALAFAVMLISGLINMEILIMLLVLMFAAGAGIGLTLPCLDSLITAGIEKKQRGSITAIYSSMRFIGVAAGPLVASLLLGHVEWMFYLFAAIAFLCSLIALFFLRSSRFSNANSK